MDSPFSFISGFTKISDELRIVTGWASVTTKAGQPVVDMQGDMIDIADLRKAVEDFMDGSKDGGYMHTRDDGGRLHRIGKVVGSMVIDTATAKALGMTTDQEGWIISLRVEDDTVWKQVKDGTLAAFSIGGRGAREAA
jgi:hypothetical protein